MRTSLICLAAAGALAGCVENPDPAEGGFFEGVQGISSGSYDARVAEREAEVAEAEARNTALRQEQASLAARISATESELARARFTLLQQRDAARNLDPALRDRVNQSLAARPGGRTDAQRLASLEALLSETRTLSAELAALGS